MMYEQINDGQKAFNNEYRADTFSNNKFVLERDQFNLLERFEEVQ